VSLVRNQNSSRIPSHKVHILHEPLVLVYPLKAGSLSRVLLKTAGGVVNGGEGEHDV
jgi:hypothetical protein